MAPAQASCAAHVRSTGPLSQRRPDAPRVTHNLNPVSWDSPQGSETGALSLAVPSGSKMAQVKPCLVLKTEWVLLTGARGNGPRV